MAGHDVVLRDVSEGPLQRGLDAIQSSLARFVTKQKLAEDDVSAALELPGVFGTLTGDEVAILTEPFFQIAPAPGGNIKDYALAPDNHSGKFVHPRDGSIDWPKMRDRKSTRLNSSHT